MHSVMAFNGVPLPVKWWDACLGCTFQAESCQQREHQAARWRGPGVAATPCAEFDPISQGIHSVQSTKQQQQMGEEKKTDSRLETPSVSQQ